MSAASHSSGCPRDVFIQLLEGEETEQWRITYKALEDGRRILPSYNGHFGAYAIIGYILDRLRTGFPMHEVELGSGGVGCVMNNADGHGLYIKLVLEDDMVVVLSFHISVHHKSD